MVKESDFTYNPATETGHGTMGSGPTSNNSFPHKVTSDPLKRVPHEKPPFTLSELKKAIPSHCFKRSLLRSFSYCLYDLTIVFSLYYIAANYFPLLPRYISSVAWPAYWITQGCIQFGIWSIAHECGHHSFSDYQWLDDAVGLVLHSCLLVPYFSWKISHRHHHNNTASLERDAAFVPRKKSRINWIWKYLNNPIGRILFLTITLFFGLPLYLICHVSGRPYDRFASHYDPYSPIFTDRERLQIFISDIGIITVLYGLYQLVLLKGLTWVLYIYGMPLLVTNGCLVLVTLLNHTHPALPHYDSTEWNWFKGALATVDRDYGILNGVFNHLTDAHVAHHLFSKMPHYHLVEATKAIKPILGEYYKFDETPFYKALYRETKECLYVVSDEKSEGVFWYDNKL